MDEANAESSRPKMAAYTVAFTLGILGLMMASESFWLTICILLLSTGLLILSADMFVNAVKIVARRFGMSELIIGLTIVSIGTSMPEILVGVSSSLEVAANGCTPEACASDFALGNIYGSVLVQISLVLGIVVLIHPLEVRPDWLARDGLLMFLAVIVLTMLILIDAKLDRMEGLILCLVYLMYLVNLIHQRDNIREDELILKGPEVDIAPVKTNDYVLLASVVVGLSLAIWSATVLVNSATTIAEAMSIPPSFIGATVTAIGTSLPELAVALTAARHSKGVAIGTLIGSNITDPLLSIGITALVHPVTIGSSDIFFYLIIPATIITTGLSLLFMYTDFKFQRWEGGVLVGCYAIFVGLLIAASNII
ncbi:MAG: hypothetical protein CMB12_05445 [Euryarchaeota archaeon]|nr:hypothetical protein [Euryarchaeota archaeon]